MAMRRISLMFLVLSATAGLSVIGLTPTSARTQLRAHLSVPALFGRTFARSSPMAAGGLSQLSWSWGSRGPNLLDPSNLLFEAPSFPTGRSDYAVATGDFNGDGNLDLVTTDQFDNQVYVLLGNGDGTFGPPVSFATAGFPSSVAVGDFNGDGRLDLAVAAEFPNRGLGSVSILLGNGDGTFQRHVDFATGTGPVSVAVADFNRDGKLDLATANSYTNNVSVLLGLGDGTFAPHRDFSAMQGVNSVAVGDLNGDGNPDIVTADYIAGVVSVLLGNGDGTFQAQKTFAAGCVPFYAAVIDLNGDGKPDLAVANGQCNLMTDMTDSVNILLGNGDGTFQPFVGYPTGADGVYVAAEDFNGDGLPDLAISNSKGNSISILLGNGDGTLRPHMDFGTSNFPDVIAVGDFNGDHKVDLATPSQLTSQIGVVEVLLGNGDGTFQARQDFSTTPNPSSVAVADFNNDGKFDLAVTSSFDSGSQNFVEILLGNGDGTFQNPVEYSTGNLPRGLASGDFNLDGNADLIIADSYDKAVSIFLGNGDGTFQPATVYSTGAFPLGVVVADFNGDGKPDFAVVNYCGDTTGNCLNAVQGTVTVWLGNGDGTFGGRGDYKVRNWPASLAVGDFNGDGKLDVVTANEAGNSVSILLGNGDGTFQGQKVYSTGGNTSPRWVTVADFNHDGKLDIVTANECTNSVGVLLGNGDGTFQHVVQYPAGVEPLALAVADFNADGALDLAVSTDVLGNGQNLLLLGNGDGTFQRPAAFSAGSLSRAIAVADFNGDHRPDVVITNPDSNSISILLNSIGTAVKLTSAPNPSDLGDTVMFTATVAGSIKGEPVPTGTVTFRTDNDKVTAKLVNGVATYATSKLTIGIHRVIGHYNGDSQFAPRDSEPITQRVLP
jgi:hypothetical protein